MMLRNIVCAALAFLSLGAGAVEPLYLAPEARCDMMMDDKGQLNGSLSEITLRCDRENFYLDAVLTAPEGKSIVSRGTKADELTIFTGDHLELMLTPRPQRTEPRYYHIVTNPQKVTYTACRRDTSWEPSELKIHSEVADRNRVWKLQLTLPFKALGVPAPVPGEQWKILIARGAENLCAAKDYHDVSHHLPLIFAPPPKPPVLLNQVCLERRICKFDFNTRNLPGKVKIRISSGTKILMEQIAEVSGKHLICTASLGKNIPLKGLYPITIQLTDLQGRVLYQRSGTVRSDLKKSLTLDAYYLLPGQSLGYRHDFGSGTVWQLFQDQKLIAWSAAPEEGKIDIPKGVSGRVVVRFAGKNACANRIIYILPQAPVPQKLSAGDLAVTPHRRIARGGKPFYWLGLSYFRKSYYPFPPEFNFTSGGDGIADNAVFVYGLATGPYQTQPFSARKYGPIGNFLPKIDKFLSANHRGDRLYRICYEANIQLAAANAEGKTVPADSAPYMEQLYRHCKAHYPGLLFSLQIDSPLRIPDYAGSCDVMELAYGSSSYGEYMIPSLCGDLDHCMRLVPKEKPVILWLGCTIPNPVCRTAEELHAAIYLCMLHGVAGNIIHMGHTPLAPDRKRIWSFLSGISREIGTLYPEIAAGKPDAAFLRDVPERGFYWRAFRNGGKVLLVMVNLDPVESVCKAKFADGKPFTAAFTPYEVRVWRF